MEVGELDEDVDVEAEIEAGGVEVRAGLGILVEFVTPLDTKKVGIEAGGVVVRVG